MGFQDAMGDDVYQPDGSEIQEDTGILDEEDTLLGREVDPNIEGYSAPERPLAVETWGTTAAEQHSGEPLERRLARELPDVAPQDGDGIGDVPGGEGEPLDGEVGDRRTGRLVAPNEGVRGDHDHELLALDVGIDSAAASAEEAAMHTIPDDEV
ncbi:hypothetical protein H3146_19890 [Streptomyces sp. OF3]|uniref:DUF5709 domain-containing protein n=1 Tax=Streptomyces alkaliterrae TaxID=2213162 RepID=A0A7W3ZPC3_9ACTN|nr:DUF5709 domain-containing protein [Streptomyces alkaliterrae]MBB1255598.1 hypothetical protein [Streptomyces alkaliterrae]